MAYLAAFAPPTLDSSASTLRGRFELCLVLQGKAPPSEQTSRLLSAYLIVVDKAMREYRMACARIGAHMTDRGGLRAYVEGVGHFETCINSAKRAVRLLARLAAKHDAPPIDRALRRVAQTWERELTNVRDAIEHIDKDILSEGTIAAGEAHLLSVSNDGECLEIAAHRISLTALCTTLSTLYRGGNALLDGLPSPTAD